MELRTHFSEYTLLDALWSGGKENAERLDRNCLWHECYSLLQGMADESDMSVTDVNDLLWFSFDYVLECLDCEEDEDGNITRREQDGN